MLKIEYIKTSSLKLLDENPRKINEDQFKVLCESIKSNPDYFEVRPILCNKEFEVFAGNMRLRAARELKLEEVPVCIMDVSKEKQKELMIRDNVSNGDWDNDLLSSLFDVEELRGWGLEVPGLSEDDLKDLENNFDGLTDSNLRYELVFDDEADLQSFKDIINNIHKNDFPNYSLSGALLKYLREK